MTAQQPGHCDHERVCKYHPSPNHPCSCNEPGLMKCQHDTRSRPAPDDVQSKQVINMYPCSGCGCMLDDNLGCPEMKICLDYHICKVAEIAKQSERDKIMGELQVWRYKRMNGTLKKDVWIAWNEETELIDQLRSNQHQER